MLFDVRATLAEILQRHPVATPATIATNLAESGRVSQLSQVSQPSPAEKAPVPFRHNGKNGAFPSDGNPKTNTRDGEAVAAKAHPYGTALNGNPRTWSGRIVSLAEWRELSDWDRHGSNGKVWNGLSRQWELRGGPPEG